MLRITSLILISCFALPFPLFSQPVATFTAPDTLTKKLDAYLLSATQSCKFNGVALIARGEHPLLHKAYGWKNIAASALNDRFPVLSVIKSFTATA